MNNFYISVSNGLLTREHRERIGSAIWEFLWLLDKITKVDDKGYGWILGGKPIKLGELAEQMGTVEMTASRNLHRLEETGYISVTRTPYGLQIKVCKAKKRFNKNVGSLGGKRFNKNVESPNRNVESPNENVESNKTVSVDSTVDTTTGLRPEAEFIFEEELTKLKDSNRKPLKIIALYWKKKGWTFKNRAQFQAALKRELRAAGNLTGYSGEEIGRSITYCMKEYPDKWTLETVFKRITDLVNTS